MKKPKWCRYMSLVSVSIAGDDGISYRDPYGIRASDVEDTLQLVEDLTTALRQGLLTQVRIHNEGVRS